MAVGALLATTGAPAARSPSRPCTRTETRAVVFAFARAWTQGDLAAVERIAAPEPHFRWVSAGPPGSRFNASASYRPSLAGYIGRRHARHDRLTITTFRFHGSDLRGQERFGHFEFTATRDADDWPEGLGHTRPGKGAIICNLDHPVLAVFSLG
jgi:hypothetical protein